MAVNETLTVSDFIERYEVIDRKTEAEMRSGKLRTFTCTAATSEKGQYMYANLVLDSECAEHLNQIAYRNDDDELVVDYKDLDEKFSSAMASSKVVAIPDVVVGETIRVKAVITEDHRGSLIAIRKIQVIDVEGGTVDLELEDVSKPVEQ